ncbi:hypothetical protein [Nonomuraea sp. NPDC050202]|uniref:hypothetical protein n=1 Tax=Nonomuraea sp. NPDC050202 TaxID=3155035 RepID=UPI0033F9B97D
MGSGRLLTADCDESAERVLAGGPTYAKLPYAKLPYVDHKGWIDQLGDMAVELSGPSLGFAPPAPKQVCTITGSGHFR